jgi:hypothetical protein
MPQFRTETEGEDAAARREEARERKDATRTAGFGYAGGEKVLS